MQMQAKPSSMAKPEQKKEQKTNFPKLKGKQAVAFQMRFDGAHYQEIADAIGLSERWTRILFCKTGKWHDHYDFWEQEKINDLEEETKRRIKKNIKKAMKVQEEILDLGVKDAKHAGRAARDILDRAGFKAPEKIELGDPISKAEEITKWFENRGKLQRKTDDKEKGDKSE